MDEKDFCDGVFHCRDRSDEDRCGTTALECSTSEFACTDGSSCVPERSLCDGTVQVSLNLNESFIRRMFQRFIPKFLHCPYFLVSRWIGRGELSRANIIYEAKAPATAHPATVE